MCFYYLHFLDFSRVCGALVRAGEFDGLVHDHVLHHLQFLVHAVERRLAGLVLRQRRSFAAPLALEGGGQGEGAVVALHHFALLLVDGLLQRLLAPLVQPKVLAPVHRLLLDHLLKYTPIKR